MKKLSFKKKEQNEEIVTLEDGLGTSLEIKKLGHVTVFEELEIADVWTRLQNNNDSFAKLKLEALTGFLRSRFEDETLTIEELAQEAGSQAMIDVLYDFMEKERSKWTPTNIVCKIDGETQSLDCARLFAELNGYVVVSRKDMKANNTYFIFKSPDSVPDNCDIEFDFSNSPKNNVKKNGVKPY